MDAETEKALEWAEGLQAIAGLLPPRYQFLKRIQTLARAVRLLDARLSNLMAVIFRDGGQKQDADRAEAEVIAERVALFEARKSLAAMEKREKGLREALSKPCHCEAVKHHDEIEGHYVGCHQLKALAEGQGEG